MASPIVFLAIFLVLQPITATDHLSPSLSPYLDDVCKEVECGKGECKASLDYAFSFICECEPGWKRTRFEDEENLRFLPCVIPNCTLDYACAEAAPPAPVIKEPPFNESFFDPCYWAYCGQGSCLKSTKHGYKCECKDDHTNLLNVTAFPCFSECALGADCESLGITVSNKSKTSTTNLSDSGENQATSILPGYFLSLTILMISLAMVPWK